MKNDPRAYREAMTTAEQAVVVAAHSHPDQARLASMCAEVGQPAVRRVAQENRCEALVGLSVRESLGGEFDRAWSDALAANEARTEELARALRQAISALEAAGCRCAVIEGGSTVFSAGLPLPAFGAGDFDILVDLDHWTTALRVMRELGYRGSDRDGRVTTTRVQFKKISPRQTNWLEVGYRAFDRTWVPLSYRDPVATWLERRTRGIDPGIPVLAATDALAVAVFHASLHSYVLSPALRLQVDIDRAVRHPEVDWDAFTKTILEMGVETRAFVSLMIAKALLASPVPDSVIAALAPSPERWSALAELLGAQGVLAKPGHKLKGLGRFRLDFLLHEAGASAWLRSLVLPNEQWVLSHFGPGPAWRAHLKRYALAAGSVAGLSLRR